MAVVLKYSLPRIEFRQPIGMPEGAEILHVGMQNGLVTLWAQVATDAEGTITREIESRTFVLLPTGFTTFDALTHKHVATIVDGPYVWHIYEII